MRPVARFVTALVLSSVSGVALAKDLPRHDAEPRSTGCEWAGQGFARLPGTDSCVKVGGSVRVEAGVSTAGSSYTPFGR